MATLNGLNDQKAALEAQLLELSSEAKRGNLKPYTPEWEAQQQQIRGLESQIVGVDNQLAAGGFTASNPPDPQVSAGEVAAVPTSDVQTKPDPMAIEDESSWGVVTPAQQASADEINRSANPQDPSYYGLGSNSDTFTGDAFKLNDTGAGAARAVVGAGQAQAQQSNSDMAAQYPVNTDWRVMLRLAPGATYLYNAADAGLLAPLKTTNGVVFPYTPAISTAYKANYSSYDLTHSNYRGYFYQNSYTDAVTLTATFTAQSTSDAAYVLAVIHFFRSVTKMFYGQDAERGSPPPLVFLSGLGDYQFNNHPCLVSQFNYTLPADVDYISSGSPNNLGLNLQPLQNLYSTTLNAISPTVNRLAASFLPPGAQNALPAPLQSLLNTPTYVPTKMDMVLTLLPTQSRSKVSKQFSLKGFANGNLLKGGFW